MLRLGQSMDEGESLLVPLSASDPVDQDGLLFSWTSVPDASGFGVLNDNGNGTGELEFIPGFDRSGTYTVTVTVTDDGNPPMSDSKTFSLAVDDVNRPPVIASIDDQVVNEGQLLEFTVTAADQDPSDTLYLTASNLPEGASFVDHGNRTGTFSWTPGYDQAGVYPDVHFEVTDGIATDSEDITITVNNLNRAPLLNTIGDKTINEGQLLEFTVTAADQDPSDTLYLTASNLPEGASFVDHGDRTATFSWTPGYDQAGVYPDVHFEVTDGIATDSEDITITVNNVNRPPVIASIDDQVVNEGQLLEFTVTINDPDLDDTINLSVNPQLQGASLTPQGNRQWLFSWTPGFDQAGDYNIVFTAFDNGGLSDTEDVGITVIDVDNVPPVISNVFSYARVTTAVITWETNEPATSQVEYGLTNQYGSLTPIDIRLVRKHKVLITGLTPGTRYHFRVRSKDAAENEGMSDDYTFTTRSFGPQNTDTILKGK